MMSHWTAQQARQLPALAAALPMAPVVAAHWDAQPRPRSAGWCRG